MAFSWEEYLDVARHLAADSTAFSDEAAKRCAISRAYYGAYCYARNWAEDNAGFKRSGEPDDHGRLVQQYRSIRKFDVASILTTLRERRNDCDYEDSIPAALNATALIDNAQKLINTLPRRAPR